MAFQRALRIGLALGLGALAVDVASAQPLIPQEAPPLASPAPAAPVPPPVTVPAAPPVARR